VDDIRLDAGPAAGSHEGAVVSRGKAPREQEDALPWSAGSASVPPPLTSAC
jgi:hypothetical protein